MFDPVTKKTMEEALRLGSLAPEQISLEFTDLFGQIIALRLDNKRRINDEGLAKLRQLAESHTILAAMSDGTAQTASALVAAHAQSLLAKLGGSSERCCLAALLFLSAESFADAHEEAKGISADTYSLEWSIASLALGKFAMLARTLVLEPDVSEYENALELEDAVVRAGLRRVICSLAQYVSGKSVSLGEAEELLRLIGNTVEQGTIHKQLRFVDGPSSYLVLVALLLSRIVPNVSAAAVAHVPAPDGIDRDEWSEVTRQYASAKPLLWRNHREAIDRGLLVQGCSGVITFPTGAGKTSLIELKVASVALAGLDAVYLAPTRVLVRQMRETFASALGETSQQVVIENEPWSLLTPQHEPVQYVSTPEECWSLMVHQPELMGSIGCVVLDECHLIHADPDRDHSRSVTAMTCLLRLLDLNPFADVLLVSAMVSNGAELSAWLRTVTGRSCLNLDSPWKPTRQARGCVVYPEPEVTALRSKLEELRVSEVATRSGTTWSGRPGKDIERGMSIVPSVLLALKYRWESHDSEDYSVIPLGAQPVPLGLGTPTDEPSRRWWLTANRNKVAGHLGARTAAIGMKTMVLCQATNVIRSTAETCDRLLSHCEPPTLTDRESAVLAAAAQELGGDELCASLSGRVAMHHGLLLEQERWVSESLFKRHEGVDLVVVSPTMSQGVNLPAEVVVIAGEERFDPETGKMEKLDASELLNAAGRAGRAGMCANGVVVVVPGAVVDFGVGDDDDVNALSARWFDLQDKVFANADQCLEIRDPLELWLDRIHLAVHTKSPVDAEEVRFFAAVRRVPSWGGMIHRSLARHHGTDEAQFQEQLASMEQRSTIHDVDLEPELAELAARFGASPMIVASLFEHIQTVEVRLGVEAWISLFYDWAGEERNREHLPYLWREATLDDLWLSRSLPQSREATLRWVRGESLLRVQDSLKPSTASSQSRKIDEARKFVVRGIPLFSWVFSLCSKLMLLAKPTEDSDPLLPYVGSSVRQGVASLSSLAVLMVLRERNTQTATRVEARRIAEELGDPGPEKNLGELQQWVRENI